MDENNKSGPFGDTISVCPTGSFMERRGTLQNRTGNMAVLGGLSGRREARQYLSQPVHRATIPSVQRTLCKISLLLLINTTEKIKSPVL